MPNELPQVFIQMIVGSTKAKLQNSYIAPDYILKVFTGLLWSPEPLCTMAVRALKEIGPEAAPSLINACSSRTLSPSVYENVVRTLVEMEDEAKDAVPEFLRLVEERHPCRASLLAALARIAPRDKRVLNYLSSGIVSEDDVSLDAVAAALNKIASYDTINVLRGLRVRQPDEEEELLVKRLESESREEKLGAIDEVEQRLPCGAQFFAEPLLNIVESDGSSELQDKAARALGYVLPCLPDALTTWLPLLMDPNSRISLALSRDDAAQPLFDWFENLFGSAEASSAVCYMCARILRNFGKKGVPYLLTGMSSSSGHRQFILARELGRVGKDATAAVPALLRIANRSRSNPWLGNRSAILDALAQIAPDDERVLALLSQIASNERDDWHHAAVAALEDIALQSPQADTQLAAEAAKQSDIAKKCIGTYKGTLRLGRGQIDVETRLSLSKTDHTKLCGDYIMHMNCLEYGELTQRRMEGRKLVFEWSDSSGSGLLELIFNDTFTEFEGVYGEGLSWNGSRDHID